MDNLDINEVLKVVNEMGTNDIINNLKQRTPNIQQLFKSSEPVSSASSDFNNKPVQQITPQQLFQPQQSQTLQLQAQTQSQLQTQPQLLQQKLMPDVNSLIKIYKGYSVSYNTLYFVGIMIFIGVVIYFLTKKKEKRINYE